MPRLLLILAIILPVFCARVAAQSAEEEVLRLKSGRLDSLVSETQVSESPVLGSGLPEPTVKASGFQEAGRGSFHLAALSGVAFMSGIGSVAHGSLSPMYTYSLSGRWTLSGSLIATHNRGLFAPASLSNEWDASHFNLAVFTAASYQLNERLVLHGAGIKQLVNAAPAPYMFQPMDQVSLGATYRITDNLSVGASLQMIQDRNPFPGIPHRFTPMPFPSIW